jgi:hypothetical protein
MRMRLDGRRLRRVAALLGVTTVAAGLMATPVAAQMYDQGTYAGTAAITWDDCGFSVETTVSFGGRFYDRTGIGPDSGAFYSHNTFWAQEVNVPQNGGRTIVVDTRAVYQDTRGTRLDGNVFLFDARVPGTTTFALADGTVILRDAGVVKQVYTIDTLGDDTPGGDDFQLLSYTFAGPHPSEDADLCAMF